MLINNPLLLGNYAWECASHGVLSRGNPPYTLNNSFNQLVKFRGVYPHGSCEFQHGKNLHLDVTMTRYRAVAKKMQHFLHIVHPHLPLETADCWGIFHHGPHKVSCHVGKSCQNIIDYIYFWGLSMGSCWWDNFSNEIGKWTDPCKNKKGD
ncbi:hypothetical protein AMTRI_Chr07g28210 [Amborella trichopoda]